MPDTRPIINDNVLGRLSSSANEAATFGNKSDQVVQGLFGLDAEVRRLREDLTSTIQAMEREKADPKVVTELVQIREAITKSGDRITGERTDMTDINAQLVERLAKLETLVGGLDVGLNFDPKALMQLLPNLTDALNSLATGLGDGQVKRNVEDAIVQIGKGAAGKLITDLHEAQAAAQVAGDQETTNKITEMIRTASTGVAGNIGGAAGQSSLSPTLDVIKQGLLGSNAEAGATSALQRLVPGGGPLASVARAGIGRIAGMLPEGALPIVGGAAVLGTAAYKEYQDVGLEQRRLQGLQGETSMGEALTMDIKSRIAAIDPLMSRGDVQKIQTAVLGSGLIGTNKNEAMGFATSNFRNYGMSADQSMELFMNAVVRAGGTTEELSATLKDFSREAKNSQASFTELVQSYKSGVDQFTAQGAGANAPTLAAAFTGALADIPGLAGARGALQGVAASPTGQLWMSQAAGVDLQHLPQYFADTPAQDLTEDVLQGVGLAAMSILGATPGMNEDDLRKLDDPQGIRMQMFLSQTGLKVKGIDQAYAIIVRALKVVEQGGKDVQRRQDIDQTKGPTRQDPLKRDPVIKTSGDESNPTVQGAVHAATHRRSGDAANSAKGYYEKYVGSQGYDIPVLRDFVNSGRNFRNVVVLPKGEKDWKKGMAYNDYIAKYKAQGEADLATGDAKILDLDQLEGAAEKDPGMGNIGNIHLGKNHHLDKSDLDVLYGRGKHDGHQRQSHADLITTVAGAGSAEDRMAGETMQGRMRIEVGPKLDKVLAIYMDDEPVTTTVRNEAAGTGKANKNGGG